MTNANVNKLYDIFVMLSILKMIIRIKRQLFNIERWLMCMREQEVKEIIAVEILKRMQDQSAARVLREILFDSNNKIDWNKASESVITNMPELKMFD